MVPNAGAQERGSHSWQDGVVPPPPGEREVDDILSY